MLSHHPSPSIYSQVLVACIVCLGGTFWWWRWRPSQFQSKTSTPAISNTNNMSDQHDNGCNNPNCLRCHPSSQQHIRAFQTNVTILRRLVKLEPHLFEGMRTEIWSAIDDNMESNALGGAGTPVEKEGTSCASIIPLSPQRGQNPTVFSLPGLKAIPLHDPTSQCSDNCPCMRIWKSIPINKNAPPIPTTGDIYVLQRNYDIIRRELLDYLSISNQQFKPFDPKVYTHATTISQGGNSTQNNNAHDHKPEWSSIYLYHQGIRQSELCNQYFPQTSHILETQCPHRMGGTCGFGSIYFSKLERNTKVKEHCGPTNIRWRCHLPLIVPKENNNGMTPEEGSDSGSCLRVGLPGVNEQCVGWKEGVPILFDDSFLHSAVHYFGNDDNSCYSSEENNNNSEDSIMDDVDMKGARIVLIVDFWHPSLTEMDRSALGVLYPPGS